MEDVEINASHVLSVARRIQGGAGPGGCDSAHWQDSLLRYGKPSENLRDSVASLSRRIANSIVPWSSVRALMASKLVALDKCPGVRPVGVGEALRRVIGKTVCMITRTDIEEVAGIDQLCAGMKLGIEGAIHAVNDMFNENKVNGWGVLLVDAKNAFNSINRAAALWNARILWPSACRFLFNTYRGWAALVVARSDSILFSKEGVTQGDPLSMFLYAVGTLPLVSELKRDDVTQVWYADDASASGQIESLKKWFDVLMARGPQFGYFPEPKKSFLVVHDTFINHAEQVFIDCGIQVVSSRRFLGGIIGDSDDEMRYIDGKVDEWINELKVLVRSNHKLHIQPWLNHSKVNGILFRE